MASVIQLPQLSASITGLFLQAPYLLCQQADPIPVQLSYKDLIQVLTATKPSVATREIYILAANVKSKRHACAYTHSHTSMTGTLSNIIVVMFFYFIVFRCQNAVHHLQLCM